MHRDAILEALAIDTGRWVLTEMELDGLTGYIGARCSHAAAVLDEPVGGNLQKVSFRQQYVPYSLLAVNFTVELSSDIVISGCGARFARGMFGRD